MSNVVGSGEVGDGIVRVPSLGERTVHGRSDEITISVQRDLYLDTRKPRLCHTWRPYATAIAPNGMAQAHRRDIENVRLRTVS